MIEDIIPDFSFKTYFSPDLININSMDHALFVTERMLKERRGFLFFTINLDHLVKLKRFPTFRCVYDRATFVGADGWPIALFADVKCCKGADLVEPVCRVAAKNQASLFLFGSTDHSLRLAAERLIEKDPGLTIAGYTAPSSRFDPSGEEAKAAAISIAASEARICFVALGAPTQEAFALHAATYAPETAFFCIGAALDFIAGTQTRAPSILRKTRLEWAWRWGSDPRRLSKRYLLCIRIFLEALISAFCTSYTGHWTTAVLSKIFSPSAFVWKIFVSVFRSEKKHKQPCTRTAIVEVESYHNKSSS